MDISITTGVTKTTFPIQKEWKEEEKAQEGWASRRENFL